MTELRGMNRKKVLLNCNSVSFLKKELFMSNSLKGLNTPP